MIYDKDFLLELDKTKNKIIYARITALTFDERPIETIEGRITQGSINVDGAAAVRRSCSLTMVANDFNYQNYYWGINTKFKLEVGVENFINPAYPDIIWFKQGIYIFTSFNTSRSTNNFNISLQGKDKMCLLDGSVGGSLEASIDFGQIEEETEDGIWQITKLPIYQIIRNAVHTYAGEPYHNIIINDLDSYGLELLEYRYDTPMYLYRKPDSKIFDNVMLENNTTYFYCGKPNGIKITLEDFSKDIRGEFKTENISLNGIAGDYLDKLVDSIIGTSNPGLVYDENGNAYIFARVEYGQTAGYRMTDLTFAGDLICNIGESVVSVLDKIKNMLTEFEYFYDLDGQFIFQRKKSFINTLYTPIQTGESEYTYNGETLYYSEQYVQSLAESSAVSYTFNEGELITAFNNNPNILNMRNDYSVWGTRKTTSGAEIPIHLRYAIDKKPTYYKTFDRYEKKLYTKDNFKPGQGEIIFTKDSNGYWLVSSSVPFDEKETYYIKIPSKIYLDTEYDWREIIYQMAIDYYQHNTEDNFELELRANNLEHYPTGRTGYERYYIDIQGFWRELYNPEATKEKNKIQQDIQDYKDKIDTINNKGLEGKLNLITLQNTIKIEEETLIILQNDLAKLTPETEDYDAKQIEINDQQEKINDMKDIENDYLNKKSDYEKNIYILENEYETLEGYYDSINEERKYWNKNVYENPHLLNFWFDFLDTEGELSRFNVQTNGARSKSVNDNAVKAIYFRETPDIVFSTGIDEDNAVDGYKYIQVNDIENMFSISAQGKSAKERLDELIYQHGYCIENATITTIPIYYLQPNTRIHIFDQETNLDGDYIISKMTIPLTYNGTMSITATKAAERII